MNAFAHVTGAVFPVAEAELSCVSACAAASTTYRTEYVCIDGLATHVPAWTDLCARALEPNIFMDPAFALPLFQFAPPRRAPRFLLLWDDEPASEPRLVGLFALVPPRWPAGTCRLFLHEQTSSGTPLIDRVNAPAILETALAWFAGSRRRATALAISGVSSDGSFVREVRRLCAASSRRLVVLEERSRAVLNAAAGEEARVVSTASDRRRKQYARQARRLARTGDRRLVSAVDSSEVAAATEAFLSLENQGWKGMRGTALLASPRLASFARTMMRTMAEDGRCRIDAVEVDGRPVAMGIVLIDGDRAYFWKTAFDEAYALYSPGVQLALELTRRQLADPAIAVTDSCAPANHPMIDRLWPDRTVINDLLVAITPGAKRTFARSLFAECARRALRQSAKDLWLRIRRSSGRLKRSRGGPISS